MKVKETISLDEINNSKYKLKVIDSLEYGKAALTHYFHNSKNGVSKNYKREAISYLKHALEHKYPENDISNRVAENALQYLLFEFDKNDVPFPPPENPDFKFIDLFSGIGGFRIAAQAENGKCVFSSEWDEYSQQTYKRNFGDIPFGDITKEETKAFIPKGFDLLCAGFPCQPFSYSGLNKGFTETRGTLFFDILDILETHQPRMFLLENVKGLKSHDGGKTLRVIENSLKKVGYNIQWQILNSYDFGLPQYRERWYCVGFREKVNFKFPERTKRGVTLRSIIDPKFNDDPKLKLSDFEIERIKFHFRSKQERVLHDNSNYEKHTKKGKHGVYSYQKPDGALRFHIGDTAKTQIQEAFYACLDTYAPTIIANRTPKLWDLKRKLSVKEAQLLQGFPKKFKFPVSDNQAYKQLGNSVAVPVLNAIIKEMLKATK